MANVVIKAGITGLSPLLMNRFHEEAEEAVSKGTRSAMKGDKGGKEEQARKKAYIDAESGELYVPGLNVYACIIAAGKFFKMGTSKVTTATSSLIPAGCTIQETKCFLGVSDFEIDSRAVVIPATGGRIMCHRPMIPVWSLKFTVDLDTSMFKPDFLREIVDAAGSKVGLGDFRPARKGLFGKFRVDGWEVL